jgi:hypothetical protein
LTFSIACDEIEFGSEWKSGTHVLNPSVTKGKDMFIGSHFVSAKLWRGNSTAQSYKTEVQAVKFTCVCCAMITL